MLELDANGAIVEWGECLPDCPQEEVSSVCIMEPQFPKFSDGSIGTVNFTSNYVYESGLPTFDVSMFLGILMSKGSLFIPSLGCLESPKENTLAYKTFQSLNASFS